MNKSKKLLSTDIRYGCSDSSYQNGRRYYELGQVLNLTIQSEGTLFVQINASVQGSAKLPYKQNIRIIWLRDFSSADILGNCSCPVGYNCKHVAAVCIAYLHRDNPTKLKAQPDCLNWLQELTQDQDTKKGAASEEFIAYLLQPHAMPHQLGVELVITKPRKTGGYLKGRKTSISNYRYSHLLYVAPEDQEIGKLLTVLSLGYYDNTIITGTTGGVALRQMLHTGRLFWQDTQQPPLLPGPARPLSFSWQATPSGAYRLMVAAAPDAQLILTDPPMYLDTEQNTLGPLDTSQLSVKQLKKLLEAPLVPAEFADEFSQRLITEHPALPLPSPKPILTTEVAGLEPVPYLRLYGAQQGNDYLYLMQLRFNYGEWTVAAGSGSEHRTILKAAEGLVRIQRHPEAERLALEKIEQWGFQSLPTSGPAVEPGTFYSPDDMSDMPSTVRWADFLDYLPRLQEENWLIEVEDSFLLSFETVKQWDLEIESDTNDWFAMHFTIDVGGQAIPLLPLIMPVLESYDLQNLPPVLSLAMADHKYINVPSEKLKPVLAVLLELFSNGNMDEFGRLRLSHFNLATLADLEQHNYGLFSLSGGEDLRKLAQRLKDFSGIQAVPLPEGFHATLRPYQQDGLNWLQFLREYRFAGILADDMGLGKTIQTLAHLLVEKQSGRMTHPTLIIAPTSLMSNWKREAQRFTPDLQVLILQGTERKQQFEKINDYDLILTTYPLLPRDEKFLLEWEYYYLVLDEAQIIKNPLSKAAKLARRINARHRLCLTGTPMENHLGELWAQFDFLMPGFLGDHATFKRLYRTPIEVHSNQEQRLRLSRRVAPFMLRRTKQEVVKELPAKTEIIRSVPLHDKQATLYESIRLTMEKKVRDAIAERGLSRSHITILEALLKLRQTCCDPRTLPLEEAKKFSASAKLDLLMEMLPELLEEGRRILVFSQFTRMIALIEQELLARQINYAKLTGQTRNRDEAIELFKSGQANVFLISLKAGGVGLNLTEADTVIIYDPWWNPATESQAADRTHRIGQDKPVFIYKLITENTVEEKIMAMQERKRALAEGIYRDEQAHTSWQLTADDLSLLFEAP